MLIANQPFTIQQWGTNCQLTLTPNLQYHGCGPETGLGDVLAAHDRDITNSFTTAWVNRASGAYCFTRLRNSMGQPTRFANYHEPIQAALDYVATNQLITPTAGEQVDLLYVSAVQNAYCHTNESTPLEEFRSDYYVAFGRRFLNVPIIGSELVVRLDGDGDVAMVRKKWRRITGVSSEEMTPSTNSLVKLVTQNPRYYSHYGGSNVEPAQLHILDMKCGYLEAPSSYRQTELRIGASLTFVVGTYQGENLPQMSVPLEDGVSLDKLWGRRYQPCVLTVQSRQTNAVTLLLTCRSGYN